MTSLSHPLSAFKNLPFCTAPGSSFLFARWDAAQFMNCWLKPIWSLNYSGWTSLVAQWLRIRLPMQGTWVQALGWEDPTCRGAAKPVRHNYWARVLQLLKPVHLEPVLRNKRSHRNEKPAHHNKE